MIVAGAIGLHNFAEGLAIGVSAGTGEIGLATVLIIGFALHNATEGFGIIGPLGDVRPSGPGSWSPGWSAERPVLLGAMIGYDDHPAPLELLFYAVRPAERSSTWSARSGTECVATDTANSASS